MYGPLKGLIIQTQKHPHRSNLVEDFDKFARRNIITKAWDTKGYFIKNEDKESQIGSKIKSFFFHINSLPLIKLGWYVKYENYTKTSHYQQPFELQVNNFCSGEDIFQHNTLI